MGFTSQDDLINEITTNGKIWRADWNKITGAAAYTAGRWYDLSLLGGTPIANTYSGTALNSQVPTESSGFGIYHGGNVSTDTKHVLNVAAYTAVATGVPAILMLVDLCLYYPGINMNLATAQTLTTGTALTRYTDGVGLRAFLVPTVATGATAHNVSLSYTDQGGASGNSLPVTVSCTASAIVGHITHSGTAANNYGPFLPLASGDTGVRSVQSITISAASGAGTAALVLCKPLLQIPITTASVLAERDMVNMIPSMPRVVDGACLTWLYFAGAATAASTSLYGSVEFGWG